MIPEKYGRPLLILAALVTVGIIFLKKESDCYYVSQYTNTLQHDINLKKVCNDRK
jgi:hypothetical protein